MKRKALLFGNSNGLQGVTKDIGNWYSFLKSDVGGQWYSTEIDILMNPSKKELVAKIESIKKSDYDYDFAIVVFSGHGAYSKGTILEINEKGECIYESDVINIAPRQISVFDCCRNVIESPNCLNESLRQFFAAAQNRNNIRQLYDKRIMKSIEQQVSLYACSIDESAYDSNNGGYYTQNLLSAAKIINSDSAFNIIGNVHKSAAINTTKEVWEKQRAIQTPDSFIPRCISSQQLIIGINPNL